MAGSLSVFEMAGSLSVFEMAGSLSVCEMAASLSVCEMSASLSDVLTDALDKSAVIAVQACDRTSSDVSNQVLQLTHLYNDICLCIFAM
jgi:hypothetical protein